MSTYFPNAAHDEGFEQLAIHEATSYHTLINDLEVNLRKWQAVVDAGSLFYLWVIDDQERLVYFHTYLPTEIVVCTSGAIRTPTLCVRLRVSHMVMSFYKRKAGAKVEI